jgi:toxin ParE1/3/4
MARSCSGVSAKESRQPVNKTEFILSACVELELGAIWARIATDNPDAATRFIELARETFVALAREPGSGRLWKFRNPRLRDVRSRHISGLDNYLVFYRPVPGGIKVLHVYHGARDIEMLKPARQYPVVAEMHQTPARSAGATREEIYPEVEPDIEPDNFTVESLLPGGLENYSAPAARRYEG